MLKRVLGVLVSLSLLGALTMTSAFAVEGVQDDAQEQINNTLEAVFEYLNNQTLSLRHLETRSYDIPVGDEIVNVTVRNEQVPLTRSGGDIEYYDIQKNSSYVYTLTINKFHSNSGSFVCKVYYDVGEPYSNEGAYKEIYKMFVTNVTATVTPPSLYTTKSVSTYIDHSYDNTNVGNVAAVVEFENAILKPVNLTVSIRLQSAQNSILSVLYQYDNLYE